ncbi:hypothetical protein HDU76_005150 [Blyttiomyces sp. JEL0837]|nr:hypothetical protein HDU76_005150 [Blyttiomyces sp. JEL0837]
MLTSPKEDPQQRPRPANRGYLGFCQAVVIVCVIVVVAVNAVVFIMEASIDARNEALSSYTHSNNYKEGGSSDQIVTNDNNAKSTFWGNLKGSIKDRIKYGITTGLLGSATSNSSASSTPVSKPAIQPPNFCNPYDFPGYLDAQYRWNPFIPTDELSKYQTPTAKNNGDQLNPCILLRGPILDHVALLRPNPPGISENGEILQPLNKPLPPHLANKIVVLIGDSQDRNTVDTFCSIAGGEIFYVPLDGIIDDANPFGNPHVDSHVCIVRRGKGVDGSKLGSQDNGNHPIGGGHGGGMPVAGGKNSKTTTTSTSTNKNNINNNNTTTTTPPPKNNLHHDFLIVMNVFHFGVERVTSRHAGFGSHIPSDNRTPITTRDRISWIPYLLRNAARRLFPDVCIAAPELCSECPKEHGGFPPAPAFNYSMFQQGATATPAPAAADTTTGSGGAFGYEDEYHEEAAAGMEWFQQFAGVENQIEQEMMAQATTINVDPTLGGGGDGSGVGEGGSVGTGAGDGVVLGKVLKPDAAKLAQEKLEAQNAGVVGNGNGKTDSSTTGTKKKNKYANYNKKPGQQTQAQAGQSQPQRRSANPDPNANPAPQFNIPKNPTPGLCLSRPSLIIAQSSLWDIEYWFGERMSEPFSEQEALDRLNDPAWGNDMLPFPGSLVHKLGMWSARIVAYLINPLRELFPNTPVGIRSCPLTTPDVYFPMWLVENMSEIAMDIGRKMGLLTFDWDRIVRGRNYLYADGFHQNEESLQAFLQMIFSRLELMHQTEKAVAASQN